MPYDFGRASAFRAMRAADGRSCCWLGMLLLAAFFQMGQLRAADTVVRTGEDGVSRVRSMGEIVDVTGKGVVLRHRSGRVETIPIGRVVDLESEWSQEHDQAERLYDQGRYEEALTSYRQSLRVESRSWVQRRILAKCVWCYRRLNQPGLAIEAFILICQQDPDTLFYDAIPLAWAPVAPSLSLENKAVQWISDAQPAVARLIGASWLISTRHRADAISTLKSLLSEAPPQVAFLAESQLWRTQIVTAESADADRWMERIEQMPPNIRGGPSYLVGLLLARHERHQEAALALLRTVILYPGQFELVPEALLAAARELERIDQRSEALRLYEEIQTHHAQSSVAQQAQQRRQGLLEQTQD